MRRRREGARLPIWLDRAETSGIADLTQCAGKARTDQDAVQAGLTLRWSHGPTGGQITGRKLRKRPSSGRATGDLRRTRVLLAA